MWDEKGATTVPQALIRLLNELGVRAAEEALRPALVHASLLSEHPELESNERLEFLGDSVLELAVAEHLYRVFPDKDEGSLSKLRGVVVSRPALAEIATALDVGAHLMLGRGEEQSGGRARSSILAAALEALIGVVFLHWGYAVARDLVVRLVGDEIARVGEVRSEDYKSLLQELGHRRFRTVPVYRMMEAEGPEHRKVFTIEAELGGIQVLGRGRSKKEAEQAAAKRLYLRLEVDVEEGSA